MEFNTESQAVHFEVCCYQLSDIEKDALNHYPRVPSPELIKDFRAGIMVMQNILSELYQKGVRIRIVPHEMKLTDLPECWDLKKYKTEEGKNYYDIEPAGLYRRTEKLIVILEDQLINTSSVNQKFRVLVHEFAHAIWDLILEQVDRDYITHLFKEEKKNCPRSREYRLTDKLEFFADGFRYYVTPHRESDILKITREWSKGKKVTIQHIGDNNPSQQDLQGLNIRLFVYLERKFKGIIDPELVMAKSVNPDEEETFDYCPDSGLYEPILNLGTITSFSSIKTVEHEAPT